MSVRVGLAITVALLTANAFLVIGRLIVTSTRRSQVEPLAGEDARGAATTLYALQHVSLMLVTCQLGVTVASTTLSAVTKSTITHLVRSLLGRLGAPEVTSHVAGSAATPVIILFYHVVFGEIVPRNISIAAPVHMLLILTPVLVRPGYVLRPIIEAMDRFAGWFVRLASYEPRPGISASYTVEEATSTVVASQEEDVLTDELGLLSSILGFSKETTGTVMVPLDKLTVLPEGITPADVEERVAHAGCSRFLIADEDGSIVDYVYLKDALYATGEDHEQPITPWRIRRLEAMSADDRAEDALRHMQCTGTHCALVRDAGAIADIFFLEDIPELLVGKA